MKKCSLIKVTLITLFTLLHFSSYGSKKNRPLQTGGRQCFQVIKNNLLDSQTARKYFSKIHSDFKSYDLLYSGRDNAVFNKKEQELANVYFKFDLKEKKNENSIWQGIDNKYFKSNKIYASHTIIFRREDRANQSDIYTVDVQIDFYNNSQKINSFEKISFVLNDEDKCDLILSSIDKIERPNSTKIHKTHFNTDTNQITNYDISIPKDIEPCEFIDVEFTDTKTDIQCFDSSSGKISTTQYFKINNDLIQYDYEEEMYTIFNVINNKNEWINTPKNNILNINKFYLNKINSDITVESVRKEIESHGEFNFFAKSKNKLDLVILKRYFEFVKYEGTFIENDITYYKYSLKFTTSKSIIKHNELIKNLRSFNYSSKLKTSYNNDLQLTDIFDFNHPHIIKAINEITSMPHPLSNRIGIVDNILLYMNKKFKYDSQMCPANNTNYKASDLIVNNKFVCGHYSTLFVALARGLGIPARKVGGVFPGRGFHAWVEVVLKNDEWIPLEPQEDSIDSAMIQNYPYVLIGYNAYNAVTDTIFFSTTPF